MLNLCVLTGNLGNAPTLNYTQGGDPICSFDMAFEFRNQTGWLKVKCFKGLADNCQKHLSEGDKIIVSGSLVQEEWEYRGRTRKKLVLQARTIEFVNVKSFHNKQEKAA